jgi:hypothetical protein
METLKVKIETAKRRAPDDQDFILQFQTLKDCLLLMQKVLLRW